MADSLPKDSLAKQKPGCSLSNTWMSWHTLFSPKMWEKKKQKQSHKPVVKVICEPSLQPPRQWSLQILAGFTATTLPFPSQGFCCIPARGGSCLGQNLPHHLHVALGIMGSESHVISCHSCLPCENCEWLTQVKYAWESAICAHQAAFTFSTCSEIFNF